MIYNRKQSKYRILSIIKVIYLLTVILYYGCNENENEFIDNDLNISISAEKLILNQSKPYDTIYIINKKGSYDITPKNPEVATIEKINDECFLVIAQNIGNTQIDITDNIGNKSVSLEVIVSDFHKPEVASEYLLLKKGEGKEYYHKYLFDPTCSITSAPNMSDIIESRLISSLGMLQIRAKEMGKVSITIRMKYWDVIHYTVEVVDYYPLIVGIDSLNINHKGSNEYSIIGVRVGNGYYSIESSDSTVITAEIIPAWWNTENSSNYINPAGIRITSCDKKGYARLTITDSAGKTGVIKIAVN
ncbi:MAG: hypothetical protein ACRC9Q_08270 [Bacteroidales bacterium]